MSCSILIVAGIFFGTAIGVIAMALAQVAAGRICRHRAARGEEFDGRRS